MNSGADAALAWVVASAFLHALWNALLKGARDPSLAATAVLAVCALLTGIIAPCVVPSLFPNQAAVLWALASGVCDGIYFITLAQALRQAPLGVAYTIIRGGAMLVVWPVSVLLLHEPLNMLTGAGAALVALGLLCAHRSPKSAVKADSPPHLGAAYLCALSVAGYHLCYERALVAGMPAWALFDVALWIALPVNMLFLGRKRLHALVQTLRFDALRLAVAGGVCTLSFVLFLSGLRDAGAGVGLTLRNTSVLFAQGMAWAIGERPQRWQLIGAVAVCAGAVLVGLARG